MIDIPICANGALLITDRNTRKYFTSIDLAEGFVVVTKKQTKLFADARYYSAVNKNCQAVGINALLFTGLDCIKQYLIEQGVTTLYVDFTKETVADYQKYAQFGLQILDAFDVVKNLRKIKSEEQLENIKKACEIAEKAYYSAIKALKLGMSETELKDRLEELMIEFGAEGASFETIVAFGSNSAVPHHQTGKTTLSENSVVLVDVGCKVNGYCSDLTRTAFFGKPSKKFLDCYQAVLQANLKAEREIYSGINGKQADLIARESLINDGLGKYFTHSLGHGIGLDIHEYIALSPKSNDLLDNGMVFSIEPGVYFDGEFGIRIEDTVALKDGKVQRLFNDDKNLILLK